MLSMFFRINMLGSVQVLRKRVFSSSDNAQDFMGDEGFDVSTY